MEGGWGEVTERVGEGKDGDKERVKGNEADPCRNREEKQRDAVVCI